MFLEETCPTLLLSIPLLSILTLSIQNLDQGGLIWWIRLVFKDYHLSWTPTKIPGVLADSSTWDVRIWRIPCSFSKLQDPSDKCICLFMFVSLPDKLHENSTTMGHRILSERFLVHAVGKNIICIAFEPHMCIKISIPKCCLFLKFQIKIDWNLEIPNAL